MAAKPKIKIPDWQLETRTFFKEFGDKVKDLQNSFNTYSNFVIGVLAIGFLVLLFSLATLLIQSWQFNSTFQSENKQLTNQEELIKNTVDEQKTLIQGQQDIKGELDDIKKLLSK